MIWKFPHRLKRFLAKIDIRYPKKTCLNFYGICRDVQTKKEFKKNGRCLTKKGRDTAHCNMLICYIISLHQPFLAYEETQTNHITFKYTFYCVHLMKPYAVRSDIADKYLFWHWRSFNCWLWRDNWLVNLVISGRNGRVCCFWRQILQVFLCTGGQS